MQVPCVNDTVHLRLSSTADLQGIVFPMVFDLQVHCEKTHCTSKLKSIVFHCPCDSALPLTCRCTVSLTLCTCDSKSHFFCIHACHWPQQYFFLQIQSESPTFNGSRFVSPLRLFHDVTLYLGCLSFVCVTQRLDGNVTGGIVRFQIGWSRTNCNLATSGLCQWSRSLSSQPLRSLLVKLQWTLTNN